MSGSLHFARDPADPRIGVLTLSNAGKLNAIGVAMWRELGTLAATLDALQPTLHAVIVRGEGGDFAAGADIAEFPAHRFSTEALRDYHERLVAPALHALLATDVPLVAQIEGGCIGGGLEIAACCDIRICGASSRFGVPIARLGFPMAPAELEIVAAVVGPTVLRELLIEARVLNAQEAFERGLVTRVVPDDVVAAEARAAAVRIAGLSPQALRLNKRALRQFVMPALSSAADRAAHYAYAPSAEHREGLAAFNEKRKPRF